MSLETHISDDEIQKVLFSFKDNKNPDPYRFNMGFFKKAWSIVSRDTINVVWSFFNSGQLLKQVNATTIALNPKVPNPSRVKDFMTFLL